MISLFTKLANDEAGFIVSAELILVATIGVLSMIVGLAEIANNVNQELEDVGSAFGCINQSYSYKLGHSDGKACMSGSSFHDEDDNCDGQDDIVQLDPTSEY